MLRATLLTVLLLTAASAAAGPRRPALEDAILTSGAAFGLPANVRVPTSREAVFGLDEDMQAFVAEATEGSSEPITRLKRLLAAMTELGLFSLDYSLNTTLTAGATFRNRRGNCLSFTLLFITLARAAGLDASYQIVDVPPQWSDENDLIVIGRHIDALIELPHNSEYVVDFNEAQFETSYPRRVVTDDHALALFYNNVGAEALIRRDYTRSFLYFRAAVGVDERLSAAWANLGLLYRRIGRATLAEAAYRKALAVDSRNGSALTNLATLYTELGETELAAEYRDRVHRYQLANPYYHFLRAKQAYGGQRFDDAVHQLHDAIRLKRDEPRFYTLQGLAYAQLGRDREAQKSFRRAKEYADRRSATQVSYASEMSLLDPLRSSFEWRTRAREVPTSVRP
jgi:Flp pilus assembly protein TadD